MISVASPEKTGEYLACLIKTKFDKRSDFCREYLKEEKIKPDQNEIRKMNNRLSQILKGEKNLQAHDLLSFARILGISCEEILTAGEVHNPPPGRLTVYDAAKSSKKRVWKQYISHNQKNIKKNDEYQKNILDYAFENRNYGLIKFLYDNNYITELTQQYRGYDNYTTNSGTFGINHVFPRYSSSVLGGIMYRKESWRLKMIELAAINNDTEMLKQMHAREEPRVHDISISDVNKDIYDSHVPSVNCLKAIANACDEITEYFSDEYEIIYPNVKKREYISFFIYPYAGELADILMKTNPEKANILLKQILKHNQRVADCLQTLIDEEWNYQDYWMTNDNNEKAYSIAHRSINISYDFRYLSYMSRDNMFKTNIVRVRNLSSCRNEGTAAIIKNINDIYDRIIGIRSEITVCGNTYDVKNEPEHKVSIYRLKK